jgi:CubicO group peptidase (beta-lactamase class C family)
MPELFTLDPRVAATTNVRAALEPGIADGAFPGAQVYASHEGRLLVDLALGDARIGTPMKTDSLVSWQCNTKPFTAAAVCLLWERGALDLDDRVTRYLPGFGSNGKGAITLRHLLTHTAGFALDPPLATLGDPDWDSLESLVCESRLLDGWVPGAAELYSSWTGFATLGAVVSRVDGRPFSRFVREEIFERVGMDDCWIGVDPPAVDVVRDRVAFLYDTAGPRPEIPPIAGVLRAEHLDRCSPASGAIGPMRQLGRFYESLLASLDGVPGTLLGRDAVRAMLETAPVSSGRVRHGLGFQVSPGSFGMWFPWAFGHEGLRSSLAFADAQRQIVVAVMVNGLGRGENRAYLHGVSREVYRAVVEPVPVANSVRS